MDRLRAFLKVAATGSIVKAADGDPVEQSQYSRQIKEVEDFFRARLIERHGKGIRLTVKGRELARISRFFLRGLANFQRGCLAEEQSFQIGASATFAQTFLLPFLGSVRQVNSGPRYTVEILPDDEIERRLHDLTLDFAVVSVATMSRPLQLKELGHCRLTLWVPKGLCKSERRAAILLKEKTLSMVLPFHELSPEWIALTGNNYRLTCSSFVEAKIAMQTHTLASFLPDFLSDGLEKEFFRVESALFGSMTFYYHLAWNPRLLRLNPPASRTRDLLVDSLAKAMDDIRR